MKRVEIFPKNAWLRECQECGNIQPDKEPILGKDLTIAYEMRKCKKCKSEALDYGSYNFYDEFMED